MEAWSQGTRMTNIYSGPFHFMKYDSTAVAGCEQVRLFFSRAQELPKHMQAAAAYRIHSSPFRSDTTVWRLFFSFVVELILFLRGQGFKKYVLRFTFLVNIPL